VGFEPVVEVTRGGVVESVHHGAVAVADAVGRLVAWAGDPETVTFLRSSAKPFQALPLIEIGAADAFGITPRELAVICASHSGTDEHVRVVGGLQARIGITESDLLCGVHMPYDPETARRMRAEGLQPTPNQHNCSGKHTGMLAHARMRGLPISDYINPEHPIQKTILETVAEMCQLAVEQVEVAIDGCSAPNFALPLYNAALGYARLCDPRGLTVERSTACRRITQSMMANPWMVGGPGRFDTRLMEVCSGRVVAKGGAEGYMAMGLTAGALGGDSAGVGIALKISDGDAENRTRPDPNSRVRPAVSLEILRQMNYLTDKELEALAEFGPLRPVANWRKIEVGQGRPAFTLKRE
jgi:L-asparaginase II